jgi:hypothetical protein
MIRWYLGILALLYASLPWQVAAIRKIESTSLVPCMQNSGLAATYFRTIFTPDNKTLQFEINGDSQVSDHVFLDVRVIVYGFNAFSKVLDPCDPSEDALKGLCPMRAGALPQLKSDNVLDLDALKKIPSAFSRPILLSPRPLTWERYRLLHSGPGWQSTTLHQLYQ